MSRKSNRSETPRKSNTKNPLLTGTFLNKKSKELEKSWLDSQQEAFEELAHSWADMCLEAAGVEKSEKKSIKKTLFKSGGGGGKSGKVNLANALYDYGKDKKSEKNEAFEKAKSKNKDLKWNAWASETVKSLQKKAKSGDKKAIKMLEEVEEHRLKMESKKAKESARKSAESSDSGSDSEAPAKKTKKTKKTTKKASKSDSESDAPVKKTKKTTKKTTKATKKTKDESSDSESDDEPKNKKGKAESEDEKDASDSESEDEKPKRNSKKADDSDVSSDESD